MEERRIVFKLNEDKEWIEINFIDIKKGDVVRLQDPDGTIVEHEDGRNTFTTISDAQLNNLGILYFEFKDELKEIKTS